MSWQQWLWRAAAVAAIVVVASSIGLAIQSGSWGPVISVCWGPAARSAAVRNQVRLLRTSRGLVQGQLAEAMGVSRQTINSIENERYTPSLPLAMALARYFDVTVEELFDDKEP
jgi:putative transcriptional regulator